MESKDLDRLFREGLDQEFEFEGRAQQWQQIAASLHTPNRKRRFAWWWLGLGIILLASLVLWQHPSKETLAENSEGIVPTSPLETVHVADLNTKQQTTQKRKTVPEKPNNALVMPPPSEPVLKSGDSPDLEPTPARILGNDYQLPRTLTTLLPANTGGIELYKDKVYDYGFSEQEASLSTNLTNEPKRALLDEVDPLPSSIQAPQRQAIKLALNPELTPTKKAQSGSLILMVGRQQNINLDTAVSENINPSFYTGLAIRLNAKWQGFARYSQGDVQRTTKQAPVSYNIPLVDVPIGFDTPNQTDLRYQRRMLDFGLRYQLPLGRFARLNFQAGAQLAQYRNIEATYLYQNIYQIQEITTSLPNQSWHLASLFGGVSVEVPLLPRLAATGSYQYYRDISKTQLRWPNSGQVLLGLQYQF